LQVSFGWKNAAQSFPFVPRLRESITYMEFILKNRQIIFWFPESVFREKFKPGRKGRNKKTERFFFQNRSVALSLFCSIALLFFNIGTF